VDKTINTYGKLDYAVNNACFDEANTTLVEKFCRVRRLFHLLSTNEFDKSAMFIR